MSRFYLGPMTKNIVDTVINSNFDFVFIPSRRQVEFNGGYVNNWTTESFSNYIQGKVRIQRDHGGPGQGLFFDNGIESAIVDAEYFDMFHVDPWKVAKNLEDGINKTSQIIKLLHNKNKKMKFEIATEEAIRKFEIYEIEKILNDLHKSLSKSEFSSIEYVSIQSGVGLDLANKKNTGSFNAEKLISMIKICKKFDKKTKEHNGDYLKKSDYLKRFKLGLDSINIAPELGQIETQCYLSYFENFKNEFNVFYDICKNSKKWEKWTHKEIEHIDKKQLITICGHYVLSKDEFIEIKPEIDVFICKTLKEKFLELKSIEAEVEKNG